MVAIHSLFGHIVIQEGQHSLKVSVKYLVLNCKTFGPLIFNLIINYSFPSPHFL